MKCFSLSINNDLSKKTNVFHDQTTIKCTKNGIVWFFTHKQKSFDTRNVFRSQINNDLSKKQMFFTKNNNEVYINGIGFFKHKQQSTV